MIAMQFTKIPRRKVHTNPVAQFLTKYMSSEKHITLFLFLSRSGKMNFLFIQ